MYCQDGGKSYPVQVALQQARPEMSRQQYTIVGYGRLRGAKCKIGWTFPHEEPWTADMMFPIGWWYYFVQGTVIHIVSMQPVAWCLCEKTYA